MSKIEKTKQFCVLCGKYKGEVKEIQFGPVLLTGCLECDKVMFNLNRILGEVKQKIRTGQLSATDTVRVDSIVNPTEEEKQAILAKSQKPS